MSIEDKMKLNETLALHAGASSASTTSTIDDTITHDAYKTVRWGVNDSTGELHDPDDPHVEKQRKKYREKMVGILPSQKKKKNKKSLDAGGPGSGRHPEQVLEDNGFQKIKEAGDGAIYKHASGEKIAIDNRYRSWRSKTDEGAGGDSLAKYLSGLNAGGPGSGRKPYGKKDHEDLKNKLNAWKKELKYDRTLSPRKRADELENRVFPLWKNGKENGQEQIDHLKFIANSVKDSTTAEYLRGAHESLTDSSGKFDAYGDKGRAHAFLKKAEKEMPGVTDKLSPDLRAWIKMSPASRDDDAVSGDDLTASIQAGGLGSGRHKLVWTCNNCGQGMYQKDINNGRGVTHCKECGEPRPDNGKGLNKWQSRDQELKKAAKDPRQLKLRLKSAEENVEMESLRPGAKGKKIRQVGTQFCVEGTGVDKNLGCYPSKAQALAVLQGKSFIEPNMDFAGNMPSTGWQYGKRSMPVGYVPQRTLSGFPSSTGGGRGGLPKVPKTGTPKITPNPKIGVGRSHPTASTAHVPHIKPIKFKVPKTVKISTPGVGHALPNPSMKQGKGVGHRLPNPSMTRKLNADGSGEPNAGAYQHAHIDPKTWFTPPSLSKVGKGNHIPTDDPGETDNKFLDVTKRETAHKDRMKILKRSAPGGLPSQIPAHTTLLSPHSAVYAPGMFASRRRSRRNGGMYRGFGAAKI